MFKIYFYPYKNAENDIDGFQAKLVNDFDHDFIYDIVYSSQRQTPQQFSSQVLSFDMKELNYIKFDHLNEVPIYKASFWQKTGNSTGARQQFQLKIKAKSFFKHQQVDSYTQEVFYALPLEPITTKVKTTDPESLKNYTQSMREVEENHHQEGNSFFSTQLEDKANFQTSIDLHIEMLAPDPRSMNSHEKLQYQIFKAKEYLEEAVMLGIDKVYLLHGVGKGRLKDEISRMLKSHRDVDYFKNEYHGSYGYGATEVFLK